ncbi:Probable polygalacturonase [Linum perenne]
MKMPVNNKMRLSMVALLLLLALSFSVNGEEGGEWSNGRCDHKPSLQPRPHSVSILEFGAVGDGKSLNTLAFQNAIFYLKSFADKGGAQLYVPTGKWLTGSFNLTSHLTLFLSKNAVILGSQNPSHWDLVDPLPSYGRGIEVPGRRYRSLINGYKLRDVVITGDDGTIDGQGAVWWDWYDTQSLNYSRPHLVEFIESENIVVSNLTFVNAPAYSIHPVYCSNHLIIETNFGLGDKTSCECVLFPDSSNNICIEDSGIETGHDAISLKSGWDEYGISYGRPTKDVHIRDVQLKSHSGSCISFGSEMSGGISNVQVDHALLHNSLTGIEFRTTKGRGGYIKHVAISDIELVNITTAFSARGDVGIHPDEEFDPQALPTIEGISFSDVVGSNVTLAGNFTGIEESPFTSICMLNVTLTPDPSWVCSNVDGFSDSVSPTPCPQLSSPVTGSSSCYTAVVVDSYGQSASL